MFTRKEMFTCRQRAFDAQNNFIVGQIAKDCEREKKIME